MKKSIVLFIVIMLKYIWSGQITEQYFDRTLSKVESEWDFK